MKSRDKPALLVRQTSAGGVVFRRESHNTLVALISVHNGRLYTIPKGLVDTGETMEETAVREVKEETGLIGKITKELGTITYWYVSKTENKKIQKTVSYYLLDYLGGNTMDHDTEVDGAYWFDIETALEKIFYKGDREILKKAKMEVDAMFPEQPEQEVQ